MATSKTTSAVKPPAKKGATPSKAPASTKAKPAVKPAVKAPVAKAPVKAKAAPATAVKKPPAKAAPKAAAPVKKAATQVTKSAKDLVDFGKKVETFQVPTSATASAPAQAVKVTETTEVKVTALPASASKLVTGDPREPKQFKPAPRFSQNQQRHKGGKPPAKPQGRRKTDIQQQAKTTDHRSNLTRRLLGDNASAHSSPPAPVPAKELIPGTGAPASQFASEALKAIKYASPQEIDRMANALATNVVENFGVDAGNLATSVVKKMTPVVDSDEEGSMTEIVAESLERAKTEALPPDDAAKRNLRGALTKMMTNQHQVLNSPAKKNSNGLLDMTTIFKPR